MENVNIKWKLAQKLEYKWWVQYLRKKNPSEYLANKIKYWERVLNAISDVVSIEQPNKILDAGCGPAGIFLAFPNHQVDAIDPLIDKYVQLSIFKPANFPWTRFRNMPLELLSEVDEYDTIFCLNAINHVNDINSCFENLVRALKPGGTLVMSTDAHRHFFLKKLFQFIPGDMLHPIQLDISEYARFFDKHQVSMVKKILFKRMFIFDYYILIAKKPPVKID
jgi:2-polyprenyl-6-hydroxyphenyl methylase/3-demethylubiquinone-9 3-methyltransferase